MNYVMNQNLAPSCERMAKIEAVLLNWHAKRTYLRQVLSSH